MTPSDRLAVLLLAVVAVSLPAFSQPVDIDYRISLSQGGVPAVGIDVVYAMVIEANWSTNDQEPFVAKLTVPPELELASFQCSGEPDTVTFHPATRVITWAGRLDNPYNSFKSCPLAFRVAPGVAPGSPFALHATLTTSKPDPDPSNNTATIGAVVLATSDLQVDSTADVRRFRPGTTVQYTLSVSNHGPLDAHDVVLNDELSPHVTFVSFQQVGGPAANVDPSPIGNFIEAFIPVLPAGSTATFRLVVVANTASEAADIVNRARAHSMTSFDPASRNNESLVLAHAGPLADLSITSSRTPENHSRRTAIALQVSNAGPDTVNNVIVGNRLSPANPYDDAAYDAKFVSIIPSQGTCGAPVIRQIYIDHYPHYYWYLECSLGALTPGAQATIAVLVERGPSVGTMKFAASVGPLQNDPRPANNHTPDTLTVRRRSVRR